MYTYDSMSLGRICHFEWLCIISEILRMQNKELFLIPKYDLSITIEQFISHEAKVKNSTQIWDSI